MQEIPTVTYDPKDPFMFRGTEKLLNYYLVAQKGPIILGIRILAYSVSGNQANVGFRIRCQTHPDYEGSIDPAAFTSTWPGIDWSKANAVRASRVLVQTVEMTPGQYDQLDEVVKKARLMGKLIALLGAAMPTEDLVYEQDDLLAVFQTEIEKQMKAHGLIGATGEDGEVSADKNAALEDPQTLLKKQILEQAKTQAEIDGVDLPANIEEQIAKSLGETPAEDQGADAAEAGDSFPSFMLNDDDDDDDSGLLPN